uniref:Uncharacterized protein n=1 Tax=Rhizophora mucronata TaxID=61149 RepID=A0A2P2IH61_RHIMU
MVEISYSLELICAGNLTPENLAYKTLSNHISQVFLQEYTFILVYDAATCYISLTDLRKANHIMQTIPAYFRVVCTVMFHVLHDGSVCHLMD